MAKRSRKKGKLSPSPGRQSVKEPMVATAPIQERPPTQAASVVRPILAGRWNLLRALLIVAVGWWVFLPALHGGWIWDDVVYIPQNPLMNDPARLWKIWFQPGSFIEYYPIQETVQWAQAELFHDHTFGYHVTNLMLHVLSALLVWRLLSRLGLRLAWLGGLLFVVHPAVVESVAWMSELKNTLSLPPFLLAVGFYLDYDERGRRRDYLWALGLFLVAMLCKISMALFPLVILLFAWWKRGRVGWRDLKAATPFFLISVVLGSLTILAGIWFRPTHHMPPDHVEIGGILAHLDLIGLLTAWYFYQIICPVTHSFFYPKWTVAPPSLLHFLIWPLLTGAIIFCWTKRRTWGRHVLLGLGFFLLNLAPFLGLTIPSYMGFTWAMDHFLYLPMIGLIGLAVAGLEQIDRKLSPSAHFFGVALLAATITCLALSSHRYAGTFADETTLWTHTVQCDPGSETAHLDLGRALMHQNRFDEAIEQFHQAERIDPHNSETHDDLGQALAQSEHLPEAMAEFDLALKDWPGDASAFANRGHLWQIMGDPNQAIADLSRAIQLNPDLPHPYLNRGVSRQITGNWVGALSDLRQYCRLAPHSANADYARMGIWLIRSQQGEKAEADQELGHAMNNDWNSTTQDWPSRIAQFLLGYLSEKWFFTFAASPIPEQDRDQHCEAWYYAGMIRLLSGDKATAIDDFHNSLATGKTQSHAYALAQGQLKLLQPH